jgi:Prp8 binding protein/COMPASS component SWD3
VNPKKHTEVISGSHDKTIKVWDVTKPKSILTMTGHKEGIWCVNYHKDGG